MLLYGSLKDKDLKPLVGCILCGFCALIVWDFIIFLDIGLELILQAYVLAVPFIFSLNKTCYFYCTLSTGLKLNFVLKILIVIIDQFP